MGSEQNYVKRLTVKEIIAEVIEVKAFEKNCR